MSIYAKVKWICVCCESCTHSIIDKDGYKTCDRNTNESCIDNPNKYKFYNQIRFNKEGDTK
jgi:hypothetical protein